MPQGILVSNVGLEGRSELRKKPEQPGKRYPGFRARLHFKLEVLRLLGREHALIKPLTQRVEHVDAGINVLFLQPGEQRLSHSH